MKRLFEFTLRSLMAAALSHSLLAKDTNILAHSTDPAQLSKTAVELAASAQAADHSLLLQYLNSASFLDRLDSADDLAKLEPKSLRVAKVIKALTDNPAPVSKQTLIALSHGGDFVSQEPRQWLLIYALVVVRPPPPEVIAFWDAQCQPDADYPNDTAIAICDNATTEAMALMEKKLVKTDFENDTKIAWMRGPMIRHRNDLPLLEACERMITTSLPMELRPSLVQALCDYNPRWYYSSNPPKPPPRAIASREALTVLRRTCEYSKAKLTLGSEVKAAVEKTLSEIGTLERRH
jgi:hypothetical protein